MNKRLRSISLIALIFAFAIPLVAKPDPGHLVSDTITAEQLLKMHLESIGSSDAVKGYRSFMAVGTSRAVFNVHGKAENTGRVVLASQSEKNMIGMKFENIEYQFEKLGFDGENFSVGYAKPGIRTPFGQFLLANSKTFKVGILGGVLSTSWELLNYDEGRGKLRADGTKKIDRVELLRFVYIPTKGSDLDIRLFFEKNTYRHVRTEYTRVVSPGVGRTIDQSARLSETRYKMVETFGDFKPENGLTIPHDYQIAVELSNGSGTGRYNWFMNFDQFSFSQDLDVSQFRVDTY